MTSSIGLTADNVVHLDYDLHLPGAKRLQGQQSCSSQNGLNVDRWYGEARVKDKDGGQRHFNDPDAQVFEWLVYQVWQMCGRDNTAYANAAQNAVGTVGLTDAQGPCSSCRSVFKAFKKEYPNVTITVRYSNKQAKVCIGLGGLQYGYDDAVERNGFWERTF